MKILLFHHALGLTPGVIGFAEAMRAMEHDVEAPDLFDGRVFDAIDDGVAHAGSVGFESIAEMGDRHAADIEGPFVVAGFSLGVLPAQRLAQQHPGVVGALLYHSAVPLEFFGGSWPDGRPVQIHMGEHDPFAEEDREAVDELVAVAGADVHWYDTAKHLIADSTTDDYERQLAGDLLRRSLDFLAEL